MPKNLQNTNYHGAVINYQMAAALQSHPVGEELLRFEQMGDRFMVQARLPEMGRYVPNQDGSADPAMNGKEFNIRVNMNYLVRGLARAIMDPNGNIDPNKLDHISILASDLGDSTSARRRRFQEFVDLLDIPAEKRAEFETFLRANHVDSRYADSVLLSNSFGIVNAIFDDVNQHLLPYQAAANGALGADAKNFAGQYRDQFENTMQSYREMAGMDPESETRILYPVDCLSFVKMTEHFARQNNAFRREHGLKEYDASGFLIDMHDQVDAAAKEGKELLFFEHAVLAADVELELRDENGSKQKKNHTISLETSAPEFGTLFHRPEITQTGVGIFASKDAVQQYHRSRNIKEIPNKELANTIRKPRPADRTGQQPIVKAPQERSFRRYCWLHSGSAVNKCSNDKLPEYAAKVIAAAYLERKLGAQGKFDLSQVHQYAEALQGSANFKAAVQAVGSPRIREAMHNGRIAEVTDLLVGGSARYKVGQKAKQQFADLAANMDTKGRSEEWKALKRALENKDMADSSAVFDTVEKYLKGKKSVRRDQKGKDSVDLALRAVAIAANSGDGVAKQRARILVDRINTVRKTGPGDRHYVDLNKYLEDAKGQPNKAPAEKDELIQHVPEERNPLKASESPLPAEHGRQSGEPGDGVAIQMSN